MKKITIFTTTLAILLFCNTYITLAFFDKKKPENHKVVVIDVIQTTNYTYLNVDENNKKEWLAVPLMEAKKGDTYYYVGAMPMPKFESKELHRTFDTVLFLGGVSPEPITEDGIKKPTAAANDKPYKRTAPQEVKKNISISTPNGGITIAELLSHKEKYSGKTVVIKGQVTKYNPSIMNKNWIHLQDGTENNGKFDLMITSDKEVKVGETVTLEGKISLNKDFGYGYNFEVMMEDALLK